MAWDTFYMNARAMLVVAVAAAATVTSACSSTVTGAASPASDLGPAPAPGSVAAAPLVAGSQNTWIDVTGQGAPTRSIAAPGAITVGVEQCTLGPAIHKASGVGDGFVTAGHCGPNGTPQRLKTDTDPAGVPLGVLTGSEEKDGALTSDSAALWAGPADRASALLAGTWRVAGVMKVDAVQHLPQKTPVCFDGAFSGVVCGALDDASTDILFDAASQPGDSGAPVFLADSTTHTVTLVGILKGGDDAQSDVSRVSMATFLEPALTRLEAIALVDPKAAAAVASDPRYSTAVSPLH